MASRYLVQHGGRRCTIAEVYGDELAGELGIGSPGKADDPVTCSGKAHRQCPADALDAPVIRNVRGREVMVSSLPSGCARRLAPLR